MCYFKVVSGEDNKCDYWNCFYVGYSDVGECNILYLNVLILLLPFFLQESALFVYFDHRHSVSCSDSE